jgi:hypothetical protein
MTKTSTDEAMQALRNEMAKVQETLDESRAALEKMMRFARGTQDNIGKIAKAKTDPRNWVGDNGPTGELLMVIRRMLTTKEYTFKELLAETGARDNRIKGVIMRLQRNGVNVVNNGTETRALWHIPARKVR